MTLPKTFNVLPAIFSLWLSLSFLLGAVSPAAGQTGVSPPRSITVIWISPSKRLPTSRSPAPRCVCAA